MNKITARYSQLVMPNDLNNIGTLFGGKMISWMDIAAGKAGFRFLQGTEVAGGVTKAIDEVVFSEPVYGGDWVNFEATLVSTGTTSFTIRVNASAESPQRKEKRCLRSDLYHGGCKKGERQQVAQSMPRKIGCSSHKIRDQEKNSA